MSYRSLLSIGGVVLLIVAATTIDTPPLVWKASWTARLGIGSVGVLLALGALLVGRRRGAAPAIHYQSLLSIGGIVLLIVAATTIDTPALVWKASWPARLGIGSVGVLLAFGALLVRRPARGVVPAGHKPDA